MLQQLVIDLLNVSVDATIVLFLLSCATEFRFSTLLTGENLKPVVDGTILINAP